MLLSHLPLLAVGQKKPAFLGRFYFQSSPGFFAARLLLIRELYGGKLTSKQFLLSDLNPGMLLS